MTEHELAIALLASLSDPAATKARLDELAAKEASIKELTETLNEARAEHHTAHTNAIAMTAAAKAERETLDARGKELDRKAADLEAREAHLVKREAELNAATKASEHEHEQRSVGLSARESRLQASEYEVDKRKAVLTAAEQNYAERMAHLSQLKPLAG